jgi:hypothetical protein
MLSGPRTIGNGNETATLPVIRATAAVMTSMEFKVAHRREKCKVVEPVDKISTPLPVKKMAVAA